MNVIVAVDEPHGSDLAAGLEAEGMAVVAVVAASALATALDGDDSDAGDRVVRGSSVRGMGVRGSDVRGSDDIAGALAAADVVVLEATRTTVSAAVVAACDQRAVRIVPLAAGVADERLAALFGLEAPLALGVEAWQLAERLAAPPRVAKMPVEEPEGAAAGPRVIAVWGPAGSPGRSTLAIELAVELARGGRHVALVDADSHAPSIALALGLADEAPGFAAACRQAGRGGLDARELARIGASIGGSGVDVLTGLNRPSRWPELGDSGITAALAACREWADYTVVDVAAPLERDEEIMSDLEGPRRNAATLATLRAVDLVVAVAAADPLGISRFLRAYPELRATIGATPVAVIANRLRPGALGIDARGQVRRTLERFGGITDVWFVPADPRAADAALLAARPIADVAPRSAITLALRRFVGDAVAPVAGVSRGIPRPSRRRATRAVLT